MHVLRMYHMGVTLRLQTDHRPLQFVTNTKDPWGRRARWIAEVQKYDFEMKFIDGLDNLVADALSHLEFGSVRVIHSIGLPTSWLLVCKVQNEDSLLWLTHQSLLGGNWYCCRDHYRAPWPCESWVIAFFTWSALPEVCRQRSAGNCPGIVSSAGVTALSWWAVGGS